MIKCSIVGNLTADPVLNDREYTNQQTGEIIKCKVCDFTVAANDSYGERRSTQYFHVAAWRGLGEICASNLKKGSKVYLDGPVMLNNYVDKNNNHRSAMKIRAVNVEFFANGEQVAAADEEDMPY